MSILKVYYCRKKTKHRRVPTGHKTIYRLLVTFTHNNVWCKKKRKNNVYISLITRLMYARINQNSQSGIRSTQTRRYEQKNKKSLETNIDSE